jgi:hypothetical protein
MTVKNDREYVKAHPAYHMYNQPDMPSYHSRWRRAIASEFTGDVTLAPGETSMLAKSRRARPQRVVPAPLQSGKLLFYQNYSPDHGTNRSAPRYHPKSTY